VVRLEQGSVESVARVLDCPDRNLVRKIIRLVGD
jgi:hypothetical protein